MDDAKKLLRNWRLSLPKDGAKCEDALRVTAFLKMDVEGNNEGHYEAFHKALLSAPLFRYGTLTMNCHAHGKQGKAHPKAISQLLKAAEIIQAAQQKEQQDNENDD